MAARSVIKNKKNQKMREAIDDIAVKCGDTSEGEGVKVGSKQLEQDMIVVIVDQINLLMDMLEDMNIKIEQKEVTKLENLQDEEKKISRYLKFPLCHHNHKWWTQLCHLL